MCFCSLKISISIHPSLETRKIAWKRFMPWNLKFKRFCRKISSLPGKGGGGVLVTSCLEINCPSTYIYLDSISINQPCIVWMPKLEYLSWLAEFLKISCFKSRIYSFYNMTWSILFWRSTQNVHETEKWKKDCWQAEH